MIWKILEFFIDNWKYSTPIQKRFKVGDVCKISEFKLKETWLDPGTTVTVLENSRHDYLVRDLAGNQIVVYQFKLKQ